MDNQIVHNFCESRLNNNNPPEILNSYTSLFITIIPLLYGMPKNNIFYNLACMLIFNGFGSFYYHYKLNSLGKQADEMSMILATYFGLCGLLKLNFLHDLKKINFYNTFNNFYMIIFLSLNTILQLDKLFPLLFGLYISTTLFFIHKTYIKYKNNNELLHLCTYNYELTLSFIGASCWIISEIYCNEYTKYGHVLWHILFPLGFYKLILKYDKIL